MIIYDLKKYDKITPLRKTKLQGKSKKREIHKKLTKVQIYHSTQQVNSKGHIHDLIHATCICIANI